MVNKNRKKASQEPLLGVFKCTAYFKV